MSSPQSGNEVETLGPSLEKILVDGSSPSFDMDADMKNLETDFRLSSSDETYGLASDLCKKPLVKRDANRSSLPSSVSKPLSSIPLPVKSPKSATPTKVPSHILSRNFSKHSRPGSASLTRPNQVTNKHTLEIQFINKKKRLSQLKKDLVEKQKPVLDLYQNLLQIKKRLEELGKVVQLEEVKLLPYNEDEDKIQEVTTGGGGETISPEVVMSMQTSIEEIPKTLMDICKNLLGRRAVIVDLLDSVTKSEVDVGDLSDKIETLKTEGTQLQNNLDAIINEHEKKIRELVVNWQTLLNDKRSMNTNVKIGDLEEKLKSQEQLTQESNQMLLELQRKLDEKRVSHERVQADLNSNIHALKNHILKLEQELELEKKSVADFKNRNNTNAQNSKMLRSKIADLDTQNKNLEIANAELSKKIKLTQDQMKHKEAQWTKEKDELSKNLKHQEHLLQKLTADKNKFETRCLIHITLRAFSEFLVPYPLI